MDRDRSPTSPPASLLNIYFNSKNIPTPNRMNWKDAKTDDCLRAGRAALTDTDRASTTPACRRR